MSESKNTSGINYVTGDATHPIGEGEGAIIVAHIVNRAGGWGAGFVMALSRRWKPAELRYRSWAKALAENAASYLPLGAVQYVAVEGDVTVANMVGQYGPGEGYNPPIVYEALREALRDVARRALRTKASVHGPRFGAGLAGGDWGQIERMIEAELIALGVAVYIYDLPQPAAKGEKA